MSSKNITEKIKKELKELAEPKYKEFHSSLCPNTKNILGIRVPILRNYAKKFKERFPNVSYKEIDNEFYEEVMLQGLLIGFNTNKDFKANIKEIECFVPKIENWAICDTFTAGLKCIKKEPDKYWEFIKSYTKKDNEFEKRFGYVAMLDYYITEKYIDEVLEILVNEQSEKYYVHMAVAWALSVCLVKFYDKTVEKMKKSKLNKLTYNKAIQKACESYRISQEKKICLKGLKR